MLLRVLLLDHEVGCQNGIIIYGDNQGMLALSPENACSERTKHIYVRYRFVREHVLKENVSMKYVHTDLMVAELMTKGLSFLLHKGHCK